ncbi:glyoxylase-like metal-dependent hydrolase (beta-lactamase superfamily II) [Arthrobacter pigmenti]|uniref:Glyoxylase-like metal-dependent hydrolase (Beta-lactamase superfamily II) n=1 Tax=Arthrobacter pigmenti TaxID=271432 RepID=A0A846RW24_9MICC|nr:N-acyl homoserine lactonase family protein [Arthrobacter pigmenti]NJC23795.1 glyoxylase-like metal-dependent hydrolase (beta-lactamase superfamily II) [Arthrobacter pigmenti]
MADISLTEKYQVTIVKFGTRSTIKSDVYLNFHIYKEADDALDMDYFFWVIQNQNRTVVVDTGFSRRGGEVRDRTFLIEPAAAVAALGIDAKDAPQVVVTHAHYDHIGNLDLFPNSELIMARAEQDFWFSDFAWRLQFKHSIEPQELSYLKEAADEKRITTFNDTYEVAPGIDVMRVGGHTPGQSIVVVETDEGQVVLASDAIHYYEEYERDLPFIFVNDLREMYEGFDTVRQLMQTTAKHLVTGHDPSTLERFEPVVEGPLAGLAATIGRKEQR